MTRVVALHVDSGSGVGLGHASRGAGLAAALEARDCQPVFLVGEGSESEGYLRRLNHSVLACSPNAPGLLEACGRANAAALVIDSYRIAAEDLGLMAGSGVPLVCFDDTAERDLVADLVVNGSPAAPSLGYRLREGCRHLLGPTYQVVRPQFVPEVVRKHAVLPATVLVTVGGDDYLGILDELISFFAYRWTALDHRSEVDVVVGPFVSHPDRWERALGVRLHHAPADLRALMIAADLAVSAGGQTLYELARCGTPTVALCVAEDQVPNLDALASLHAIEYIGWAKTPGWLDRLAGGLEALWGDLSKRIRMAETASRLVDGHGAARVADEIVSLLCTKVSGQSSAVRG